jgi:hypothetical protein
MVDDVDEDIKQLYNTHSVKISSIRNIKTAVNMWFQLIFGINPLKNTTNHLFSKVVLRKHPIKPKYHEIWNLKLVLYLFKSFKLNKYISNDKILLFEFWQRNTIILIAIYCQFCLYEICNITTGSYKELDNDLCLHTVIKTDYNNLILTFIFSVNGEICDIPMIVVLNLIRIDYEYYSSTPKLFICGRSGKKYHCIKLNNIFDLVLLLIYFLLFLQFSNLVLLVYFFPQLFSCLNQLLSDL